MKNMTLENIAKACNGILFGGCETLEIEGVVSDSRQIQKDDLFLAIKGEKVDGHQFITQVMEKGAAAALCEEAPKNPVGPYILVKDVLKALQEIAIFYREQLSIPIVGITGSVGKTSTKEFIASVLSEKFCVLKTEGNFNNEIGVPLTLLKIREEHEIAVLEMGINHFGEMHRLSKMVKPDVVVMTNIGQCHLEFLGSRDGILKAKSEIFDFMNPKGAVIINGDDDKLSTLSDVQGIRPLSFGLHKNRDIYAEGIVNKGLFGTKVDIHTLSGSFEANIPLPGEHMIYNALAATALGLYFHMRLMDIAAGISHVPSTSGRSNLIKCTDKVIIDDCYNANPVSMCAALDLLALADTRKVAILGDMFELGDESLDMHGKIGEYAVEKGIEVLVCIGEMSMEMANAAVAADDAKAGGACTDIRYYLRKDMFFYDLDNMLQKGDTILVKASHGMGFAEIVEKLTNYNIQ